MHMLWSGSINFSLVNIPIKLYSGSHTPRLNLTLLHKKDNSPIKYQRICRAEDKEVPYSEIVKGFEYDKDEYVILNEKDFEKASVSTTHTIDIIEFVDPKSIDIRYYDRPFYLEPNKGADKPYALLREVLIRSKKIAVATFVLHNREHVGVVKPIGDLLVLNRIRYEREILDASSLKIPKNLKLKPQEIKIATTLVKQLSKKFSPKFLHDTYDEDLEKIVEDKIKGKHIKPKKGIPSHVKTKNLMTALKASLKQARTKKSTHRRKAA